MYAYQPKPQNKQLDYDDFHAQLVQAWELNAQKLQKRRWKIIKRIQKEKVYANA